MDSTTYYNKNAKEFYDRTIHADVQDFYQRFLKYLPEKGCILDAGCGVGRDSKFFKSRGYDVVAFDGSIEMVKMAKELLGQEVHHLLFQDVNFSSQFHGIWAKASLLHIPYENLGAVISSFHQALLPEGIFFASFKYGNSMRAADDRFFFDMNEETIEPYLNGYFKPLEIWKSVDTRSKDKSWLNFIAKKYP